MAIKTFATGEVLTASDTNTFLANSGLVYVTGGTVSATLLSVSNCFTSTYRDYVLVIDDFLTPSGVRTIGLQLQSSGTPHTSAYYWAGYYSTWAGGFGAANSGGGGMASWSINTTGGYSPSQSTITIANPNNSSKKANIVVSAINYDAGYHVGGYHDVSANYDGFRIFNSSSDTCNFNWALYGYRKA
jgi:hypothetical protein